MSKKKMVAAEFNTVDVNSAGKPVESSIQSDVHAKVIDKLDDSSQKIKPDVREKLEQFEKMEKTVSALSRENEALKEKLAEYLEELSALRDRKPEIKEVVKEVPVEKIVEKIVEVPSVDTKLTADIKALREENDSYLMKISELTFENAKLTASMSELKKKCETPKRAQPTAPSQYANVYRNASNANGYSSWN